MRERKKRPASGVRTGYPARSTLDMVVDHILKAADESLPNVVRIEGQPGVGKTYLIQRCFDRLVQHRPGYWNGILTPAWPPADRISLERDRKRVIQPVDGRLPDEAPGFYWIAGNAAEDVNLAQTLIQETLRQIHLTLEIYKRKMRWGQFAVEAGLKAAGVSNNLIDLAIDAAELLGAATRLLDQATEYDDRILISLHNALKTFRDATGTLGLPSKPFVICIDDSHHMTPSVARTVSAICFAEEPGSYPDQFPDSVTTTPFVPCTVLLVSRLSLRGRETVLSPGQQWLRGAQEIGLNVRTFRIGDLQRPAAAALFAEAVNGMDAADQTAIIERVCPPGERWISPLAISRATAFMFENWDPLTGRADIDIDRLATETQGVAANVLPILSQVRNAANGQVALSLLRTVAPWGPKLPADVIELAARTLGQDADAAPSLLRTLIAAGAMEILQTEDATCRQFVRLDFSVFEYFTEHEIGDRSEARKEILQHYFSSWVRSLIDSESPSVGDYRLLKGFWQRIASSIDGDDESRFIDSTAALAAGTSPLDTGSIALALRIITPTESQERSARDAGTLLRCIDAVSNRSFLLELVFTYLQYVDIWPDQQLVDGLSGALERLAPPDKTLVGELLSANLDPASPPPPPDQMGARFYSALRHLCKARTRQGDQEAVHALVPHAPQDMSTAFLAWRIFLDQGRSEEALRSLGSWTKSHWNAATKAIRCLENLGRDDDVAGLLAEWAARDPRASGYLVARYRGVGLDTVRSFLGSDTAAELNLNSTKVRVSLAQLHARVGNVGEVLRLLVPLLDEDNQWARRRLADMLNECAHRGDFIATHDGISTTRHKEERPTDSGPKGARPKTQESDFFELSAEDLLLSYQEQAAERPSLAFRLAKRLQQLGDPEHALNILELHNGENEGHACLLADLIVAVSGAEGYSRAREVLAQYSASGPSIDGRIAALDLMRGITPTLDLDGRRKVMVDFGFLLLAMQRIVGSSAESELELHHRLLAWTVNERVGTWAKSQIDLFVAGRIGAVARGQLGDTADRRTWPELVAIHTMSLWPRVRRDGLRHKLVGTLFAYTKSPEDVLPRLVEYQVLSVFQVFLAINGGDYPALRDALRRSLLFSIERNMKPRDVERLLLWTTMSDLLDQPGADAHHVQSNAAAVETTADEQVSAPDAAPNTDPELGEQPRRERRRLRGGRPVAE